MNIKTQLFIPLLFAVCGIIKGNEKINNQPYQSQKMETVGITVGTKINDSTGQVSISNSEIESEIISKIKFLNTSNITSAAPRLAIGKNFSYLVFSATSQVSQDIEIAIEVTFVGSAFEFQNIAGKQIHIWQPKSGCTSCGFFQDWQNEIIGCNCNSSVNGGCDHFMFITE